MNTANRLQELYLLYLNEYLTVERFAADYFLTPPEAGVILAAGREIHEYRAAQERRP